MALPRLIARGIAHQDEFAARLDRALRRLRLAWRERLRAGRSPSEALLDLLEHPELLDVARPMQAAKRQRRPKAPLADVIGDMQEQIARRRAEGIEPDRDRAVQECRLGSDKQRRAAWEALKPRRLISTSGCATEPAADYRQALIKP